MNKKTSQTQWDYPEEEDEEEADETGHTDRQHSMSSRLVSGKWQNLWLAADRAGGCERSQKFFTLVFMPVDICFVEHTSCVNSAS